MPFRPHASGPSRTSRAKSHEGRAPLQAPGPSDDAIVGKADGEWQGVRHSLPHRHVTPYERMALEASSSLSRMASDSTRVAPLEKR